MYRMYDINKEVIAWDTVVVEQASKQQEAF